MQTQTNRFDYREHSSFAGFTAQFAKEQQTIKPLIKLKKHPNDKVRIAISKRTCGTHLNIALNSSNCKNPFEMLKSVIK